MNNFPNRYSGLIYRKVILMRYTLYREHKYVSFRCNELERSIAKTDFRNDLEVVKIKEGFEALMQLLEGHAHYENESLHTLLKKKQSIAYKHIEEDHAHLDDQIAYLRNMLNNIDKDSVENDKIEAGYHFYLSYRKFVGDNLIHLHEEETIILPELQRLYSDEELKKIESGTYNKMTSQELTQMMEELFPHMNPNDWEAFLQDVKNCEPVKFKEVWHNIKHTMTPEQQTYFITKLNITSEN